MIEERCLIIAEAGVNHNGKLDLALRLCDAAKESGADVIKFQTWITEDIVTKNLKQAHYQVRNTGNNESQYEMLKKLELSFDSFIRIKQYCDNIGIVFSSTADDYKSLDFLVNLGVPFIKVGSGDIGNVPFLRKIGTKGLPIILSTGMSSLADVDLSIKALREGGAEDITLLHCTTNYPCPFEQVNLRAMNTLQKSFHLPVGYSDHTLGTEVAVAAVSLGAIVIEKHFTLDKSMEGPDHLASIDPNELKRLVKEIRNVEMSMGDGVKIPTLDENKIKNYVTKRIVASKKIDRGQLFSEENICIKRSDKGELAKEWDRIVGMQAVCSYKIDDGIEI